MRMAALVDQHSVNRGAQVGAVVQIESAQVELVGFAFAAVLADDQAGNGFQQFTRPVNSAGFQLLLRYDAFVCCPRLTQQAVARALNLYRRQGWLSVLRLNHTV